jgi:hypothetical protein
MASLKASLATPRPPDAAVQGNRPSEKASTRASFRKTLRAALPHEGHADSALDDLIGAGGRRLRRVRGDRMTVDDLYGFVKHMLAGRRDSCRVEPGHGADSF